MSQTVRDDVHYTYGQYLGWSEDERYELIDGMAYAMSPAPTRVHQEVVGELFYQIAGQLRDKPCRVYVAPFDVRLPKANEANDRWVNGTYVRPQMAEFKGRCACAAVPETEIDWERLAENG